MATAVGSVKDDLKEVVGTGHCSRCGGLMVAEWFIDLLDNPAQVLRCVQCGELIDPVILQNRRLQLPYDPGIRERN